MSPPEFDTSSDASSIPAVSSITSASTVVAPATVPSQKGVLAPLSAQPLQQSSSNTFSVSSSISSLSSSEKGKERLTSPSPLGTADSNVVVVHAAEAPKAVKRGAVAGAAGEKRKKALKRL